MSGIFADRPRILRRHLLLGQNVFHSGSVLMADIALGQLSDVTLRDMPSSFGEGFPRMFGAPPPDRAATMPHLVLAAVLSLESRILSILGHEDGVAYSALDIRPDDTVVLIWATAAPALSRSALTVALAGMAELSGTAPDGAEPFADGLARLLSQAERRRLDAPAATLQAAAAATGIPCHVTDGEVMLGEGARQRKPFGNDAFWTAHAEDAAATDAATAWSDTPASVVRLVPRGALQREDARAVIDGLFPDPHEAVIPSLVFAGDLATTAAAEQAAVILEDAGFRVGLALKRGVLLDGIPQETPGGRVTRGPAMLLRDPATEVLVTALSLRRVVNYGLGFSRCDGVALQLAPGADASINRRGIDVLARACAGPFTIDAGHPARHILIDRIGPGRTVLMSQTPDDAQTRAHLAEGGLVATRDWGADGPVVRLLRQDGVLACAPLESRARTRERLIYAGMHAFALVQAAGLARHPAA